MQASGLGKLTPNMILCGFLDNWQKRPNMISDYVEIIQYAKLILDIFVISKSTNITTFEKLVINKFA